MDEMIITEYLEEFKLAVEDALEHKTLATVGVALTWWQKLMDAVMREPELEQLGVLEQLPNLLPDEWGFWMTTWDRFHQERKPYEQCH